MFERMPEPCAATRYSIVCLYYEMSDEIAQAVLGPRMRKNYIIFFNFSLSYYYFCLDFSRGYPLEQKYCRWNMAVV
jgi:hypothetical protein